MSAEFSKPPALAAVTNGNRERRNHFYEKGVGDLIPLGATPDERLNGIELIRSAISIYEDAVPKGVYDENGVLVPRIECGAYIRRDKTQRRLVRTYWPKKGPGRPPKNELRVLVSGLAQAYLRITGKVPSRNWDGEHLTEFEHFVRKVFDALGLADPLGWVRKHIESRDKKTVDREEEW
jgi:hypothetical protein